MKLACEDWTLVTVVALMLALTIGVATCAKHSAQQAWKRGECCATDGGVSWRR